MGHLQHRWLQYVGAHQHRHRQRGHRASTGSYNFRQHRLQRRRLQYRLLQHRRRLRRRERRRFIGETAATAPSGRARHYTSLFPESRYINRSASSISRLRYPCNGFQIIPSPSGPPRGVGPIIDRRHLTGDRRPQALDTLTALKLRSQIRAGHPAGPGFGNEPPAPHRAIQLSTISLDSGTSAPAIQLPLRHRKLCTRTSALQSFETANCRAAPRLRIGTGVGRT